MKYRLVFFFSVLLGYVRASDLPRPRAAQYGFIENKGQVIDQNDHPNKEVLYLYNGVGLHVQLKQNGFSYEVIKTEPMANAKTGAETCLHGKSETHENAIFFIHRIDISFLGANSNPKITASLPAADYINYYTTGTPEEGVLFVKHYGKITYQDLYPNIDVEFVLNDPENHGAFKYNIIVRPGGNPDDIKLNFEGANNTYLTFSDQRTAIALETSNGGLMETIPYSYQLSNAKATEVEAHFTRLGSGYNHVYGIAVSNYQPDKLLIIDPAPWATYYGGSGTDVGTGIITDTSGNVITSGYTESATNIATTGAYQVIDSGDYDGFIVKLNTSGVRQWATYFGGTALDQAMGITKDGSGNILITGHSSSNSGIATNNSYQSSRSGAVDAFVAKFNSTGSRIWGTYYGGSDQERCYSVATDLSGNVCITGATCSLTGIATSGGHRTSLYFYYTNSYPNYVYNIFVAKINTSGTSLLWGTYYGGHAWDGDKGIAITTDTASNVLVTGITLASTGIATSGAYQTALAYNGVGHAFIVKFNSSGTRQWGTYYGGPDNRTYGNAILTDISGNIYIAGDGPISLYGSTGSYQPASGNISVSQGSDAFVAKFNSSGTTRIWGTFYGGLTWEWANGMALDATGNILITGQTSSSNGIATSGTSQTTLGGSTAQYDAFVAKLNPAGSALLWGTYYGGSGNDYGNAIAVYNNTIYITGQTASTSGRATTGAHQTTFGGGAFDAFIATFTNNGSLLVTWLDFTAKLQDDKTILLNWQTAGELNNKGFEIEHSIDGTNFESLGFVNGNGSTNSISSYSFTDNSFDIHSVFNIHYYRLKQLNFDGHSEYSKIVSVNLTNNPYAELLVYPNPNNGSFTVSADNDSIRTIKVFDVLGNIVSAFSSTDNKVNIHLPDNVKGIYFISVQTSVQTYNSKVIVE